jgi:hypothetical protein
MAAHRYWRLYLTVQATPGVYPSLSEVVFRDSGGTPISTAGKTLSASSEGFGLPVANAFDGNSTTEWHAGNTTLPAWVKCDFGAGGEVDVAEILIGGRNGSDYQSPRDFELQWSDDNSAWTALFSVTDITSWKANNQKTFPKNALADKSAWRVNVSAVGAGTAVGLSEMEFRTSAGGADTATDPENGIGSSNFGQDSVSSYNCHDDNTSTEWSSAAGLPQWVGYDWDDESAHEIAEVMMRARGTQATQAPTAFTIEYRNAAGAWVSVASFSGVSWSNGETKTFTVPVSGGAAQPAMIIMT